MPNLDLANYDQDLRALTLVSTDVNPNNGGRRIQRANSLVTQNVVVISGNAQVTLLLAEAGLYVDGFTNGHGTYWFAGANGGAGNQLHFNCGYVGNDSMDLFTSPGPTVDTQAVRRIGALDQSVRDLQAYAGGADYGLKLKLAMMVLLTSESIRFSIIYRKMVDVCMMGGSFTFEEFRAWVQNWNALSGGVVAAGLNQARLFTWHH